jgi:hypothetical protein
VAVPSEYADMGNGDAHIGWSMIIGAGNASGWAYDEMQAAGEAMPGDGQLLVKDRVGIGNRLPQRRLDILDTTDPQLRLTNVVDTITPANDRAVDFHVDANGDLYVLPLNTSATTGRITFMPALEGSYSSDRFFRILNTYMSGGTLFHGSVFVVDNSSDSGRGRVQVGTGRYASDNLVPDRKLHVRKGGILINPTFGEHGIEIRELSPVNSGGGGWARNVKFSLDNEMSLFDIGVKGNDASNFQYGYIGTGRVVGVPASREASYEEPSLMFMPDGRVGVNTTWAVPPAAGSALDVNGAIFQRGASLHADYVFEPDYSLESIEDHSAYMWKNKHLKAVPAVQKNVEGKEVVDIGAMNKGILEELEKAHVYIEQLNNRLKALEKEVKSLKK